MDAVVSGQETRLPSELIGTNKGPQALVAYSKAFNQGLISVGRLMEVVVFPFLKLAKAMDKEARSPATSESAMGGQEVTKALYGVWNPIIKDIVDFKGEENGPPLLRPAKRTVLLRAMFDAKVPEVRQLLLVGTPTNSHHISLFSANYTLEQCCSP